MIASYFKKNKIKAKVLLIDHNPDITIKAKGFHAAFNELYKDYIEYKPSMEIKSVDVAKKTIKTEFDTITFDDGCIYPGVRGSTLLEKLGVMDAKNPQKEALIDTLKYNVIGDDRVYVTGDSRPHPYSKSANTSNTEAKYVAKVLAARAQGKDIEWYSPETICYSLVNAQPAGRHLGGCDLLLRPQDQGVRLLQRHQDVRRSRCIQGPWHTLVGEGHVQGLVRLIS